MAWISPVFADSPGFQVHTVKDSLDGKYVDYRVVLVDLEFHFRVETDFVDHQTFKSVVVPRPFRVRERVDLISVLDERLENAKGREEQIARFLAGFILPHINQPEAAALMVQLAQMFRERGSYSIPRMYPVPDDAESPPLWFRLIGNSKVLDAIEKTLEVVDPGGPSIWPLPLLTTTDSPRALTMLKGYVDIHPEYKAWIVLDILQSDHASSQKYQTKEKSWTYLASEVLPDLARNVHADNNGRFALYVWWSFSDLESWKFIDGFAWEQVEPLAELYLQNLLLHPEFDQILKDYNEYEMLLRVGRRFGSARQIELLEQALQAHEEETLFGPDAAEKWPWGRGGGTSGPRLGEAVSKYKSLKILAIEAMKQRKSRLEK